MSSTASPIPAFYRVVFRYIDPVFCTLGIYMSTFQTKTWLESFNPQAIFPPKIETTVLNGQLSGFFAALGLLQVGIAWGRPRDVGLWKLLQASTFVLDVVSVYYFITAVNAQGRLSPSLWRWEEYQNILGNAGIGLIRLVFCLGVGSGTAGKKRD